MRYQELLEYINYDKEKFLSKWKAEGSPFADSLSDGEFASWLEQYDPTPGNKYVNWMIVRYLKDDITRLEDIPSRIAPALDIFMRLGRKKKLKPEHKDLGKITNIEDVIDEYKDQDTDLSSKSEVEDNFYKSGDAELVYNDSEYKVVVPKTEEASKYFGKNTRWCTAAENNNMFSDYADDGSLYIILQKATNKRWQFHFESGSFMDERDEEIDLGEFLQDHKKIFTLFEKLNYVFNPPKSTDSSYAIYAGYHPLYYDDNKELHRLDGPASIDDNDIQRWYKHGRLHRENGPAIIGNNGHREWWFNGQRHRLDGPAILKSDGSKSYYIKGQLHRENGPAVINSDGYKAWKIHGKNHRTDGPAMILANGTKYWFVNDKKHRTDGPAIEWHDGDAWYFINGLKYSKEGYDKRIKKMKENGEI